MRTEEIDLIAKRILDLREAKEKLADETKQNNEALEKANTELINALIDSDKTTWQYGGKHFTPVVQLHASIKGGEADSLFAELRRRELGDIIKEKIDPRTLTATVKDIIAENNDTLPEWLKDKVSTYEKTTISVRKI